jgi:hypothetical protein
MALFMATKIEDKAIFKKILLEYFWDSWMTVKEQIRLLLRHEDYHSLASEMVVKSGTVTAIRSVNPETGILEFVCPDGNPCPPGVREALMSDTIERKANVTAVGGWYGFYVPKRGGMVFKINKPHEVGKKPKGGQEICGRSGSGNWREPMVDLQKSLPPMGFDEKSLIGSGISNNIQGCTVVELCMRYMDEKEIEGKRWFFRPISSFMTGHTGQISQTAKLEVKAILAEQKKVLAEEKKGAKAKKKEIVAVATQKEKEARVVRLKPKTVVPGPTPGKRTLKSKQAPALPPVEELIDFENYGIVAPAPEDTGTPPPPLRHDNNMTKEQRDAADERAIRTQAYAQAQAQAQAPIPAQAQVQALPPVEELIDFENLGIVEPQPAPIPAQAPAPAPAQAPAPAPAPAPRPKPKKPTIRTERGQNE